MSDDPVLAILRAEMKALRADLTLAIASEGKRQASAIDRLRVQFELQNGRVGHLETRVHDAAEAAKIEVAYARGAATALLTKKQLAAGLAGLAALGPGLTFVAQRLL